MIWSIVPEELLSGDSAQLEQLDYLGRKVLARKNADGAYELSALLSSDPQDFLDPRFAVGSIICQNTTKEN
ncbi:MAG: hypothetical protein IJF62_03950 [Firmicutes bacterium]|nr:hypothetical protein [Bacillota bacterium]MBQ3112083.1 hypothetical protein [Bacillota bacterium]MBQ6842669.1 hypothetical protein [Bacillota bacterium]